MKKWAYIIVVFLLLAGVISWQNGRIKTISDDRDSYRNSTYSLLDDVRHYQTKDSLNAVSVRAVELKLSEYKKYREEDLKLINDLKVDKKRIQGVATTQTETIYKLQGTFKDSIVYRDNYVRDTLHCIDIKNYWFDMTGCIGENSEFDGNFEDRQELMYVEHIVPNKFLFIKWGCKERRQEILSLNPNTNIVRTEYVTIRK